MPEILTIPSSDIYTIRGIDNTTFFKLTHNGTTYRDLNTDISQNLRTSLEVLAKVMQIPGIAKLKKKELIQAVSSYIRFE
jgi:hypothetical protein